MTTRLQQSCHGRYWSACWVADGCRRSRNLGAVATMTRRQAEEALQSLVESHVLHPASKTARTGTTLLGWCERYLVLRSDLAPGSLDLLRRTITLLTEHFDADPRLDRITPALAQDWRIWLEGRPGRRDTGLSGATVAMHIRGARAIMNAAIQEGLLGQNPFRNVRSIRGGHVEGWREVTVEETERLLEVLPNHAWRAWVGLMRFGGLRSGVRGGEALWLTWGSVDFGRHMLTVTDQKRRRTRTVPIVPRLYEILTAAHAAAATGEPRVCPIPTAGLDRRLRRYIARAGIDPYKKPAHSLRKSCASELAEQYPAYAVALWMGHSPKVAQRHYYQPSPELVASVTGLTKTQVKRQAKADQDSAHPHPPPPP